MDVVPPLERGKKPIVINDIGSVYLEIFIFLFFKTTTMGWMLAII
jgi:hypothetical protein